MARAELKTQLLVMVLVGAAFLGLVALVSMGGSEREPGSALAASACTSVVDAGREAATGSRSMPSFLSVVESQEGKARSAVNLNEKYRPILESIVALRTALVTGGDVSRPAGALAAACG